MPTVIYHITHLKNLPSIITDSGLYAQETLQKKGKDYTSIAYPGIQERRAKTVVPCGPGGTLHHYVPFHFAPRSPMLLMLSQNFSSGV